RSARHDPAQRRGAHIRGHPHLRRPGNVAALSARALRAGRARGCGHAPLDPGHRHAASLGDGARARAGGRRNTRRVAAEMDTLLPAAAVIVFIGYLVFGVTGFGASPITVPVLAHFLPLPFVLSLAAALDLGSAAVLGLHTRKQADVRELLVLAPFTIIGLALGVTLLVRLPRDATLLALGIFVCGYALYIMLRRGPRRLLSRMWAAPAGILSGILGALFGVGGPPYVAYIAGRIPDGAAQRATISQMVVL